MSRKKILIVDTKYQGLVQLVDTFGELVFSPLEFIKAPQEFRLVLFTGGADIDPKFYNHTSPQGFCQTYPRRDQMEGEIFKIALANKVKMAGICRGAQLICALSGGSLMHDIQGHLGGHIMESNLGHIMVNSIHHQMMLPGKGSFVAGVSSSRLSKTYYGDKDEQVMYSGPEVEAIICANTNSCGVQYHPEMMKATADGVLFFIEMMNDLLSQPIKNVVKKYAMNVTDYDTKYAGRQMAVSNSNLT
jgi:gamma-glutamyl-gamma-aminobutyrate hydrolase PuuD